MSGFIKVLVASGCAMLSGGVNVWLNVRDKKIITRYYECVYFSNVDGCVNLCAVYLIIKGD